MLWYTYGGCRYSMPKEGTVQKVVNFIPFKKPEFLNDYYMWYGKFRMDRSILAISAFWNSFYRSDTQQREISLCLLVCLKKKAFSSDEWLFFFRKVTTTFSAAEMMTKFVLSLAAKIQTLFYQHMMEYKPKYEENFRLKINRPNS